MNKIKIELEPEALDRVVFDYLKREYDFLNGCDRIYLDGKELKKDIKALKRVINYMSVPDEQI